MLFTASIRNETADALHTTNRETEHKIYYVATNGHDSNPGTMNRPLRSIQTAANKVWAGDIIYVREGVYVEQIDIQSSGTAAHPLTIMAYPGEHPVIDGRYELPSRPSDGWGGCNSTVYPPKCFHYDPLVNISGNYVTFAGFEIKRSLGRGLRVYRQDGQPVGVTIKNNKIHDIRNAGIKLYEVKNVVVDSNEVWHSGDFATHDRGSEELDWPMSVSDIRSENIVYRNNTIHSNWSEGLGTGINSDDIVIEDNTLYDNRSAQIYIQRTHNVLVQRNLVYCTNHPDFMRSGSPAPGIVIRNEAQFAGNWLATNVEVYNNIVVGCGENFTIGGADSENVIKNVEVTHNTFVNAVSNPGTIEAEGISIRAEEYDNVRIENNIIYQDDHIIASTVSHPELTFANNLWSRIPPKNASSPGDIVEDPLLVKPDSVLAPGAVDPNWYKAKLISPARKDGRVIVGITDDFFGHDANSIQNSGIDEHEEDGNEDLNDGNEPKEPSETNETGSKLSVFLSGILIVGGFVSIFFLIVLTIRIE